jgi:hypothetical protein
LNFCTTLARRDARKNEALGKGAASSISMGRYNGRRYRTRKLYQRNKPL